MWSLPSLLFIAMMPIAEETWDHRLYELVYQAEVHGQADESLKELETMLALKDENLQRRDIIRAISVIKRSLPPVVKLEPGQSPEALIATTQAVIWRPPMGHLFVQGVWLELGDWVGNWRIIAMDLNQIVFGDLQGNPHTLSLPRLQAGEPDLQAEGAKFFHAPIGDILAFATLQEKLNYYFPSAFNTRVDGFFQVTDWQALIDQLCSQSEIISTRRLGSLVFERGNRKNNLDTILRGINRKNRKLGNLLQEIADTVGLELVIFDEALAEVAIDLHADDQPWDEALDCLSIMNGFNWAMMSQRNGPDQLVVTSN